MTQRFSIGMFSKLTGLTPRALRLYEHAGLLRPEVVNPATGYRYYTQEQAWTAERIRLLRSTGMPLEDIRALLSMRDSMNKRSLFSAHKDRMERQVQMYLEALNALAAFETRDIWAYPIAIKTLAAQPVICLREQVFVSQIEVVRARAFGELFGFLQQAGVSATGPGFTVNAGAGKFQAHEDLGLEERWSIDVCVPVDAVIENHRVQSRVMPAGQVAYAVHTGPYRPLFLLYKRMASWIEEHGLVHTGQTLERYLLSPADALKPDDLRTEVQFGVCERHARTDSTG
jgi:DNA-binding transcriptional MerR regulator